MKTQTKRGTSEFSFEAPKQTRIKVSLFVFAAGEGPPVLETNKLTFLRVCFEASKLNLVVRSLVSSLRNKLGLK